MKTLFIYIIYTLQHKQLTKQLTNQPSISDIHTLSNPSKHRVATNPHIHQALTLHNDTMVRYANI